MRNLIAVALSVALTVSGAAAATSAGPLAPGKPASVRKAQEIDKTALIVIVGIAGAVAAIAFATASSGTPGGAVTPTSVPSTTS